MAADTVEWYPLPEVGETQSLSDAYSSVNRTYGETSRLKSGQHGGHAQPSLYTPAATAAPPDLTILSTGSLPSNGRAKPYLSSTYSSMGGVSTPSLHLPPTSLSPNELDKLWQRFLSSALIQDQSGWPGHHELEGRGCSCNCHQQLLSHGQRPTYTPFPHYKHLPKSVTSSSPKQAPALPLPSGPPSTTENKALTYPAYSATQNQPSSTRRGVAFNVAMPTGSITTGVQTTPMLMKEVSSSKENGRFHITPLSVKMKRSPPLKTCAGDAPCSSGASHSPSPTPTSVVLAPTTQDASHRLEELTLPECCQLMKARFIRNSKLRQLQLRERSEQRASAFQQQQRHTEKRDRSKHITPSDEGMLGFVKIVEVHPRPKMTYWQMYEQSKRYWDKLPEVKERERAEKRKVQIRTNRLRVKLYQREVLCRLRRKRRF